jgi:hypothetical protein
MIENQMKAVTDHIFHSSFGVVTLTTEDVVNVVVYGVATWTVHMGAIVDWEAEFFTKH